MTEDRLRIAYLCDLSPLDRSLYSGGNAQIHDALARHAGAVTILPQHWGAAEPLRRTIEALPAHHAMRLRWRAHYAARHVIGRAAGRALRQGRFDVVFGAYSLAALSGVALPRGVVTAFSSDAVQTVYRLSEIGARFGRSGRLGGLLDGWVERRERAALARADLLLWPSDWLREAVETRYGTDPARAHVLPWGANIAPPPAPAPRVLDPAGPLRLLVIGRDWWAKGGPLAFETMAALRAGGIDARLTVIGCTPPEAHRSAAVTVHGLLDRRLPAQARLFEESIAAAHFLLQPSYESYGFAFCEAAALGLPALGLRVGGVPLREGVNGHALPSRAGAEDFAAVIRRYRADPAAYAALCASARRDYETRLNWDTWGRATAALLRAAVAEKRTAALA
jgi:glycosyltransferase involved in cell wall biosynthesis